MFSLFKKKPLLSKDIQDAVVKAIAATELNSRGEIRVFVESHCAMVDTIERCEELFQQLKMHETKERNGVLLYLAIKDRQFAIVGDKGINDKVGGNAYWQNAAEVLRSYLVKGEIKEGICTCVASIGASLTLHFPDNGSENINELSDEIVFGK